MVLISGGGCHPESKETELEQTQPAVGVPAGCPVRNGAVGGEWELGRASPGWGFRQRKPFQDLGARKDPRMQPKPVGLGWVGTDTAWLPAFPWEVFS